VELPELQRFLDKDSEERKFVILPIKRELNKNKWIIVGIILMVTFRIGKRSIYASIFIIRRR
jgi:hypothetical protein